MRVGVIQLNGCDDPARNLQKITELAEGAVSDGAQWVLTPEVSNMVSTSRDHQIANLHSQADDPTLAAMRSLAARHNIWLTIGSLAIKTNDTDGRFANRGFMISPDGKIAAKYDKIHMFDVQVSEDETYRESDGFRAGYTAPVVKTPFGRVGMTICYDMRFPYLYRALAQAGADLITVPAAFTVPTGQAHWHTLLRARAIETGCFVIAPAQTGTHSHTAGAERKTFGHSLVVDPWGAVLLDAEQGEKFCVLDLNLSTVQQTRHRLPSLTHDRPYQIENDG